MKCIVMILISLYSSTLLASNGKILKCLGGEEKRFHLKKEQGPVYDLNQKLMSELIQIPDVEVNDQDLKTICQDKNFSESWKLLELSIKKGKELFVVSPKLAGMQLQMTNGMIDDYVEATREILLGFISQIQTASPTPTCLKEEVPELNNFFIEIKYLQEDVDMKSIFKDKDQKIFDKLKHYPEAFKRCSQKSDKRKLKATKSQ